MARSESIFGAAFLRRLAPHRAVVGFAALAVTGTAVAFGFNAWYAYANEIDRVTRANAGVVLTLEEQTIRGVQTVNSVLWGLADYLRRRPEFQKPGNPEILDLLQRRRFSVPELAAIIVVNRHADLTYHTERQNPEPLAPDIRDHFVAHSGKPNGSVQIGAPFLDPVSGRWLAGLSRPITNARGEFAGVVVALVAPEVVANAYPMMRPREDGIVEVFTRDGICFARDPDHERCVGRPASIAPTLVHRLAKHSVGTYSTRTIDGSRRIVSYRALQDLPMIVAVSSSLDATVGNWRKTLYRSGLMALAIGLAFACGAHALIRQVSRRMASEAAVAGLSREVERKSTQLEVALAHMSQGLCLFDSQQRLLLCNRRYMELYRFTGDLIRPGMSLREIMEVGVRVGNFAPDQAQAVVEERVALGASREPAAMRMHLQSGQTIEVAHRPLPSGGFVATYTDITAEERVLADLRGAKEQAELANRAKSDFLANMSHELRTPLNAIIGFSQIMTEEMFGALGSPRYRDYAYDIKNSSEHLLHIINDLLDMAKVEAGRQELLETPLDIMAASRACLRLVRERAETAGVRLQLSVPDDLPLLLADERLVKQVLLNLLSNAVKFTPKNGSVTVSAALAADGACEITVRDTGVGIAPDDIPKVMKPFGQVDGTYARTHGGTGLGLSIVRALAELHGAAFHLDSVVGKGTTATIRFPPERVLRDRPAGVKAAG